MPDIVKNQGRQAHGVHVKTDCAPEELLHSLTEVSALSPWRPPQTHFLELTGRATGTRPN